MYPKSQPAGVKLANSHFSRGSSGGWSASSFLHWSAKIMDAAVSHRCLCLKGHRYQLKPFKRRTFLITAALAFFFFHTITWFLLSLHLHIAEEVVLWFFFFNFQRSCLFICLACCFQARVDGLWAGGWADGWQSLCPLRSGIYTNHGFSQSPHRCASFHRCLLFPSFVCTVLCVHACVILIWVLSISHIGVEGQCVPSNNDPLEYTGSVLM